MTHIVYDKHGNRHEVTTAPERKYIMTLVDHNGKTKTKTKTVKTKEYGLQDMRIEDEFMELQNSGKYASVGMVVQDWRDVDDPYWKIERQ